MMSKFMKVALALGLYLTIVLGLLAAASTQARNIILMDQAGSGLFAMYGLVCFGLSIVFGVIVLVIARGSV